MIFCIKENEKIIFHFKKRFLKNNENTVNRVNHDFAFTTDSIFRKKWQKKNFIHPEVYKTLKITTSFRKECRRPIACAHWVDVMIIVQISYCD